MENEKNLTEEELEFCRRGHQRLLAGQIRKDNAQK